jgi:outer membrane immunogenic protein
MKYFLVLAVTSFFCTAALPQSPLAVGKSQVNFGVGLSEWGVPVYFGLDYGALRNVTIGGEVSYRSYRENWKDNYYRHNIIGFSVNGNYHFNSLFKIPPAFDLYAGPSLGFYTWSSPGDYRFRSGRPGGRQVFLYRQSSDQP